MNLFVTIRRGVAWERLRNFYREPSGSVLGRPAIRFLEPRNLKTAHDLRGEFPRPMTEVVRAGGPICSP